MILLDTDWGWGSWWHFLWFLYYLMVLYAKSQLSTWRLMASRTPLKIDDTAGAKRTLELPDWGWYSWWCFWWFCYGLLVIHAKSQLSILSLRASRTPLKIEDTDRTKRTLELPDWGWYSWWRFWIFWYGLIVIHAKYQLSTLSLNASRTPLKIDDIAGG